MKCQLCNIKLEPKGNQYFCDTCQIMWTHTPDGRIRLDTFLTQKEYNHKKETT